ncbi:hypothetical protein [Actinocorallia sp. A-T 12471]|uniref:hypothetical protein n=1 Tax=Actinocorallia sp. A-T 12471 TaxID=3089813 RepID=UPI0029CFFF13|nr:hypothetical protein [Actinocorallia sp. A-T 12471]MDX6743021.1 hypothetical protein [Actinocorallia sp. A-T 12471]
MNDPRLPRQSAPGPRPPQGRPVPRPRYPEAAYPEAAVTGPNPVLPDPAKERDAVADKGAQPRKGGGGGAKRPGKGKRRSQVFFGAAAALLVVVLAAVVAVFALRPDSSDDPGQAGGVRMGEPEVNGFTPGSYSSSPSTDVFAEIDTRALDPEPLKAEEMFPKGSALEDETTGAKLARRAAVADTDCADAIWGQSLARALGAAGCSQAVRGLYTDAKKGFAALVAVYNLRDSSAANAAVEAFGAGSAGFVRVPEEAPEFFGQGFGMARGIAMGHYALIAWVQRTDGTGDGRSAALLSVLVTAAEADALYTRAAG